MQKKNLLILQASSDVCSTEIDQLTAVSKMFGIVPRHLELKNSWDLLGALTSIPERIDYLYLASHANTEYFGDPRGAIRINWEDLGYSVCDACCLNPESILLLGCCRGGQKTVALRVFCACDDVDYICGPRWAVRPADITLGFHVFMYNMLIRSEQPSTAVKRASQATNYDFFCHDRVELHDDILAWSESIPKCTSEVSEDSER